MCIVFYKMGQVDSDRKYNKLGVNFKICDLQDFDSFVFDAIFEFFAFFDFVVCAI